MSVEEKLQKGRDRLNKAGNDPDLLGLALTSIHGALEDTCRNWLSAPAIKQQHGIDLQNKAEANWQNILELMPKYCGWSEQDVKYVRRMNALRNQAAHGDGFEADELLKIAINSNYMIQDSRSQFTLSFKDGLIFINSCKTQMSFVLEHNDRLWESLRCRMLENNLVELTKSELKELYNKKLQAF